LTQTLPAAQREKKKKTGKKKVAIMAVLAYGVAFFGSSCKEEKEVWIKPCTREDSILRGPRSSSIWVSRNLSHHTIRQASTGDAVLVKSRETIGRSQSP
jgi:hypothetical protein